MTNEEINHKELVPYGFEKQVNPVFYELLIGDTEKFAYPVPVVEGNPMSLMKCYKCEGIERRVLGPSNLRLVGNKIADIYYHPRYVLVGSKVSSLLKENNLIGYKLSEVIVSSAEGIEEDHLSELRGLEVLGRCYKITSISGDEIKHCSACSKVPLDQKIKADSGIKIVEDYWDGSDIFMFDYGLLSIIVTDKIKKIFEHNKISNVSFLQLKDLKMR